MEDDRFIPTSRDLPQRVKALMFDKDDAIDAEGRYKFVKKLGSGAMGKVFLFQDTRIGNLRALKTVDEILMQYPEAVEALKKECQKMYALTHPNIVAVRDLAMDRWQYRYYIVMDYVKGETLREYLKIHPKPDQGIAMEIIRLMAEALDYAHRSNIVHGDVKPENTMVEIRDKVNSLKLTDFGLSYHIQATTTSMGVSRMSVRGTPAYMAPELFETEYGGSSEPQKPGMEVDLYALGTVAYEMLAGRRPFNGPNDIVLAHNVIYGEVPEISGMPNHVNAALKKALAKKPEDRFKNCGEFAKALSATPQPVIVEKLSSQPPVIKTPSPTPKNVTLTLPSNVPLELVHIHAGSFIMGSPVNEPGRKEDETKHLVTLTKDFWLGKYSVTQGQWKAVMGTTLLDQANKRYPGAGEKWIGNMQDDYPMYFINWKEALRFCRLLTERDRSIGRLSYEYEYTLPTEAQWEYACRAGTSTALYNGDIVILGARNVPALDEIAWYAGNSSFGYEGKGWDTKDWEEKQYPGGLAGPRQVGGKKPNAWGLYDMSGNVYDWCYDWYGDYPSFSVTDPVGPSSGSYRIARGGSWSRNSTRDCRSAYRSAFDIDFRFYYVGFRVALVSAQ